MRVLALKAGSLLPGTRPAFTPIPGLPIPTPAGNHTSTGDRYYR
ncbi:MAG: hypothetical protein QJR12_10730 [Mycobacterium sp.]|nr:hypothetical protein [Mycobacterium sp.]MDI3314719.1 hypothetical protein [Mycobacterium sp.]